MFMTSPFQVSYDLHQIDSDAFNTVTEMCLVCMPGLHEKVMKSFYIAFRN